ncbi:hypothetical protein PSPO01_12921 [Paraphaeosphaeria sporulosa]
MRQPLILWAFEATGIYPLDTTTILSSSVQNQLLEHENKGLREALVIQKKRLKRGRPLPLDQLDEYYGGAIFWSPYRKDIEKQQTQLQESERAEARRASQ